MPELTPPVTTRDHRDGPDDASVTLLEFGDFECPDCARAYLIVKDLQKELGKRLRFVYRNFPLNDIHPYAQAAAEAAEAAGAQGQFWTMHDTIFENQDDLDEASIAQFSEDLGLDIEKFAHDTSEHVYAGRVSDDLASGRSSLVQGTPTFYLNGLRHDDSYDFETLLAAIKEAEAG
ncbi:MAG: thioredoxin domain-containing protein [Capsulimonas sp.]|uniref:DsbA family protein n=1 Tax=Capsulimonas sp. TaxID=2494211 RepID=UPI003264A5FE